MLKIKLKVVHFCQLAKGKNLKRFKKDIFKKRKIFNWTQFESFSFSAVGSRASFECSI
jgi:hypothetical protein